MEYLNLIIQYVNDPRADRQAEYEFCMRANLANPYVKSIHNLQERADVIVPAEISAHPKYRQHALDHWLTYADAFAYAGSVLPNEICGLINLDIFLDQGAKWAEVPDVLLKRIVLCLSRTEFDRNGNKAYRDPQMLKWGMAVSQDAWIFKSPITVKDCDFGIGTLGCDNAIAHRIKESDYLPINASHQFQIFHLDQVRGKSYENHDRIYHRERRGPGKGQFPERSGQLLLPDIDMVQSVDQILTTLNLDPVEKYMVICDVLNKLVNLQNINAETPSPTQAAT